MESKDDPNLQPLCQLTTEQILFLTEGLSDELLRRALASLDPRARRYLNLGVCHLVELRGRLRMLRAVELETTPAAPVPATRHSASEESGAPTGDTTTAGAAGVFDTTPCPECRGLKSVHSIGCPIARENLMLEVHAQCSRCRTEGVDHEGECRPLAEPETAPALAEPSEHLPSGQRGPKGAEGVGEADRAEQARGELAPAEERPLTLAERAMLLKRGVA